MRTILAPVDFSVQSRNSAKYALAYAAHTGSKVTLYHSFDDPTGALDISLTNPYLGKEEAREEAEKTMKKWVLSMMKLFPKSKIDWVVQPGDASENIVEYIIQNNIPLVIMGTSGKGMIYRNTIGSTTSNVITNTSCTVIAVPPKARFRMLKNIVFASVLEKEGFAAVSESVSFARKHDASISLIHVQDLNIQNAEAMLEVKVETLKKKMEYKKISYHLIRDEDVADGLDSYIRKYKPDMLSMASHGRKFPQTLWKRSWTNKMLAHTEIPLLIFHLTDPPANRIKKKVRHEKATATA